MTILFQQDWFDANNRPRALVQTTTKNKSFRRQAIVLRDMGIKNNLFHLSLYDPVLLNVDPHALNSDTDPDGTLRLRVGAECKRNIWYYMREVIRISVDGSADPISFKLSRGNLSMLWCFMAHIDYSSTMPRQQGKTISAIAATSWVMYISGLNMRIGMLTHSADLVQANVKRLKQMKDGLPTYLIASSGDDVDNKEGLDYKALDNIYYTYVGQKDRTAANRVGRGKTGPMLHMDELGTIPNLKITFPAIMATTNSARENAKKAGQPHSNIYTTTAADPQTEEGAYAFNLVTQAMPFTEKLYDCPNEAAVHQIVKTNSTNNLVNGTFSYLQLGLSHEWFRDTITRNNVPPDEVERDYLNHWVSAAKSPILSKEVLEKMYASRVEPHHVEIFESYVVSWYVPQEVSNSPAFRNSPIILGMDSSEAIGRDFTTFVGIDPRSLRVLCSFRCNDSNVTKIAIFVAKLLLEFRRMLFVPERKSTGANIIDTVIMLLLRENHNPFLRIFNQIVDKKDQKEFDQYDLHDLDLSDSIARRYLGFMTTSTTRAFLYKQVLQRASTLAADKMYDRTLVTELSGLQAINGRIDHKNGHHDDMCFVGSTLVRTITGNRPISELKVGDLVLTRKGYKPILYVYCHEKEVITKYNLTGTTNHPFITPDGICEFGNLTDDSEVYVWNEKQSSIMVKRIIDTLNQNGYNTKSTFTDTIKTKLPLWLYTGKFGKIITDLYQKVHTSTTKTETIQTTKLKILNVSHRQSILRNILPHMKHVENLLKLLKLETLWESGEKLIPKRQKNTLLHRVSKIPALQNGVMKIQNLLVSVRKKPEEKVQPPGPQKEIVYNLCVAECYEYFVNDILVHNCIAWLLACYVVLEGKNLHYYGLTQQDLLQNVVTADGSPDLQHINFQLGLRTKIQELTKLLNNSSNETVRSHFRYKVAQLENLIDSSLQIEPTSVETVRRDPTPLRTLTDNIRQRPNVSPYELLEIMHFS